MAAADEIKKDQQTAWEDLANAIVHQAASDWRRLRHRRAKDEYHRQAMAAQMADIERFFRSRWFGVLTDVNPQVLMAMLRAEGRLVRRNRCTRKDYGGGRHDDARDFRGMPDGGDRDRGD